MEAFTDVSFRTCPHLHYYSGCNAKKYVMHFQDCSPINSLKMISTSRRCPWTTLQLSKWDTTHTSFACAAWKWHCIKPWCCLTLKAAFQEGRTAHKEGKHTSVVQGMSSQQIKRLLWHEWQDFSWPPPLPHLIKFKVLGLASRICFYLTILVNCQCPLLWLLPRCSPPSVTPAFLSTYFMNV